MPSRVPRAVAGRNAIRIEQYGFPHLKILLDTHINMNAKHIHGDNVCSFRSVSFGRTLWHNSTRSHVSPLRVQQKVRAVLVEDDNIVVIGTLAFHVLSADTFVVRFLSPKRIPNHSPTRTVWVWLATSQHRAPRGSAQVCTEYFFVGGRKQIAATVAVIVEI